MISLLLERIVSLCEEYPRLVDFEDYFLSRISSNFLGFSVHVLERGNSFSYPGNLLSLSFSQTLIKHLARYEVASLGANITISGEI